MATGLAYIPCATHNLHLVVGDGFDNELDDRYKLLIKRVSKHIVNKSKVTILIAEELRNFGIKMCKRNVTRWNSILFMVRSVLKLSPVQFDQIRDALKKEAKSKKQKDAAKNFYLTMQERHMLEELVTLLSLFEYATDELQGDGVTISRVYPAITLLKHELSVNTDSYTKALREKLLESLERRFPDLLTQDVYLVSTFLDPNFGLYILKDDQSFVLKLVTDLCEAVKRSSQQPSTPSSPVRSPTNITSKNKYRYTFYNNTSISTQPELDETRKMIEEYVRVVNDQQQLLKFDTHTNALEFWKKYESSFPILALLARKYLSVQVSFF